MKQCSFLYVFTTFNIYGRIILNYFVINLMEFIYEEESKNCINPINA